MRVGVDQQRVTIGGGLRHHRWRRRATRARMILDRHRLPPQLRKPATHRARDHLWPTPGPNGSIIRTTLVGYSVAWRSGSLLASSPLRGAWVLPRLARSADGSEPVQQLDRQMPSLPLSQLDHRLRAATKPDARQTSPARFDSIPSELALTASAGCLRLADGRADRRRTQSGGMHK